MRVAWLAVLVLAAGCGTGGDPRYGTVRVGIDLRVPGAIGAPVWSEAQFVAVRDGALGMTGAGPTVALAASPTEADGLISGGTVVDPSGAPTGSCCIGYDPAAHSATIDTGCARATDDELRRLAAHVAGHLLGMGHIAARGVMQGAVGPMYEAASLRYECVGSGAFAWQTDAPTDADRAEYARTHP